MRGTNRSPPGVRTSEVPAFADAEAGDAKRHPGSLAFVDGASKRDERRQREPKPEPPKLKLSYERSRWSTSFSPVTPALREHRDDVSELGSRLRTGNEIV